MIAATPTRHEYAKNTTYPAPNAAGVTPTAVAPSTNDSVVTPPNSPVSGANTPPPAAERAAPSTMRPDWEAISFPGNA